MRHRKLFTLAAGASAVVFVAVCVLWVRSYFVGEGVGYTWKEMNFEPVFTRITGHHLISGRGSIGWARSNSEDEAWVLTEVRWHYHRWQSSAGIVLPASASDKFNIQLPGFQLMRRVELMGTTSWISQIRIVVPYWLVCIVLCIVPVAWWRRRKKPAQFACDVCGYDLRATPDRCPECGRRADDKVAKLKR